jgi:plastocyanin
MTRIKICSLIAGVCFFPALLLGARSDTATGIIKGTVTIEGKPTQDVVVSVVGLPKEQAKALLSGMKTKKAVLDQRAMKFSPYVLPVVAGSTVEFPNNDTTWHNVYSKGGAKDFDLGLYAPGKTRSVTFDKPGVVRILCNAHPSMEAFIVVNESPYFSSADSRGNYRLDRLPLGKYRIQVWHPQFGTTEAGADLVRDGEVLDLNFDLKRK